MYEVGLRPLDVADLPILLAWAHIPKIWEYLPTSRREEGLTWEGHWNWWVYRENRVDWMIVVREDDYGPRPVGVIHIIKMDSPWPEIGLYLGDIALWERGVGKMALGIAMDKACHMGLGRLKAVIHPLNERSVRLFKSLGFKKKDEARRGQHRYEYSFSGSTDPIPKY